MRTNDGYAFTGTAIGSTGYAVNGLNAGATVSSGTRQSLQRDHEGSIVSVANASGSSLALNTYDEYGVPGASNAGRFQYTGQIWLAELGMYYYQARIYDL